VECRLVGDRAEAAQEALKLAEGDPLEFEE